MSASCASTRASPSVARLRLSRVGTARREVEPAVTIYTDGACSGNPGPGGWGAILRFGEVEKELTGGEALTTNNRMELMAAIAALEALKRPCRVDLYTDSQYVRQGITELDPRLEEERLAHRRQEAGQERRSLAAARRRAAASTRCAGTGSRATPATTQNERADQLAREGMAMARLKK